MEFGFTLSNLVSGLDHIASLGWPPENRSAMVWPIIALKDSLRSSLSWSDSEIEAFISTLSLRSRTEFVPSRNKPDVYPWRYNRALSYLRRPLIVLDSDGSEDVAWGPRHIVASIGYWINTVRGARLKADSTELQRALAARRNELTEGFNDYVGELLSRIDHLKVRVRAKKFGQKRISDENNQDLGDIDVLALNLATRTVWVLETKDFEVARTPAEIQNEVGKMLTGSKATVNLHERRTHWVEANLSSVLRDFNLVGGHWMTRSAIVLSEDIISARMTPASETTIVPVDAVVDLVAQTNQTGAPKTRRRSRRAKRSL